MLLELQKQALRCGVKPLEFWDYTVYELKIIMDNFIESRQNEIKTTISMNYNTASLIANFVCRGLNGDKLPALEELYPDLFAAETTPEDEEKAMQLYKEQFLDFANAHNRKLRNTE
jgi:hypothetical protein